MTYPCSPPHFEVHRSLRGTVPDHLSAVVEDHRAAFVRGGEDVTWGGVVRLCGHVDGGRVQVGGRAEGPRALRRLA